MDQQILVEEVSSAAQASESEREAAYADPNYAKRFTERLKTVHQGIESGATGVSKAIQDWTQSLIGKTPTKKQLQFASALQAAKGGEFLDCTSDARENA
jgi:hypothetical protein